MTGTDPGVAVRARALNLGFHRVGIAATGPLVEDHARYLEWIAQERHGGMAWLAENAEVRRDAAGPGILDGARSVIVCALSYHRGAEVSPMPGAEIARYARGGDYHNFLRRKLRKLATWLRREFGAEARPVVDTAPMLERAWARRAGVGFVGRNGCVIAPGLGSYLLLGEVVTNLALPADATMEERCGSCTRCLDLCPTSALVAPRVLDARRCVSYLTIEHDGAVDVGLRAGVGDRVFGCDVCQDVCPFNRTAAPPLSSTSGFAPDPRWSEVPPEAILAMEPSRWDRLADGSPLARPGWERMSRNAAIVLGNVGSRRHLPVLRERAADRSGAVAGAAAWAIGEIERRDPSE